MENITTYTANEVSHAIQRNRGLLLIHFGSPLASSCELVHKELARMAPGFDGRLGFAEVELPLQDLELIQKYGIESLPTLILYQGSEEVERVERLMLEDELQEFLELSHSYYSTGNSGSEKDSEDL